jgi:hypothetical protein
MSGSPSDNLLETRDRRVKQHLLQPGFERPRLLRLPQDLVQEIEVIARPLEGRKAIASPRAAATSPQTINPQNATGYRHRSGRILRNDMRRMQSGASSHAMSMTGEALPICNSRISLTPGPGALFQGFFGVY